jgi:hypothetical protein
MSRPYPPKSLLPTHRLEGRSKMARSLLTISFIILNALLLQAQNPIGDTQNDWQTWIESYYKNPQPDLLFIVYSETVLNPANQGTEPDLPFLGFVASALKEDSVNIEIFYSHIREASNAALVESFGWILWYMNSPHCSRILNELLRLPNQKKNKKFLVDMSKKKPVDIFNDNLGLSQPRMLLYDFYATGSQTTMNLLLSKIDSYESPIWIEKAVATNVVYSLRGLCKKDSQILQYCREYVPLSKEPTTRILTEIINEFD